MFILFFYFVAANNENEFLIYTSTKKNISFKFTIRPNLKGKNSKTCWNKFKHTSKTSYRIYVKY